MSPAPMTIPYRDLSRPARRRLVVASLVRSFVAVALLVVAYFAAPLDRPIDVGSWIRFGTGLAVFGVILTWQIRVIMKSAAPRLQAVQTVAIGLPALLLGFAAAYVVIGASAANSFTEPLTRTDSLYFTVTVFTTVGFGDISPVSETARVVTTIQMLVGVTVVGVIAKLLLGAVQTAERRRGDDPRK